MIGDTESLPLNGLQIHVRVEGFRARVLMDADFYNDRGRQLEGTFQLRLPNEASPYFFAFGESAYAAPDVASARPRFFSSAEARDVRFDPADIMTQRKAMWVQPKEARMVPREKAAHAYRETVHRYRVDPALMEWAGAGVFNARVFPLAPGRAHRIVVGYDVDLQRVGDDLEYRLDVPDGVPACVVDLDVEEIPGISTTVSAKGDEARSDERVFYRFENPKEREIAVRLGRPGPLLLSGTDEKGGEYFAARFRPDVPAGADAPAAKGGGNAVFLVDVSLSANPQKFATWLKLLRSVLDNNRDSIQRFGVCFFNIETFWWKDRFVENTPANVGALMDFADDLALEGATDLGAGLGAASQPWFPVKEITPPWDLFVLSDGAPTWGETDVDALAARVRTGFVRALYSYGTGEAGTDVRVLGHLARDGGGALFSIAREADIASVSTAHRTPPWRLEGVSIKGGEDLLLAGRPVTVFPGQELALVGRGAPKPGTDVELVLRRGSDRRTVSTKLEREVISSLAVRAYGQVAVGQLEEFRDETADVSKAYATHFRVTGQTCSLLMLESEADYQRYGIRPEEDAFLVKEKLVSVVLAQAFKDAGDRLRDPKAAFLAWVSKLESMPGMEFRAPAALRAALDRMPASSFAVAPPPLNCRQRTKIGKGRPSGEIAYDAAAAEAQRRLKQHGPDDALKALSSLVEQAPGDAVLARDVGYSALEWGLGGHAYGLFRRVAEIRPWEAPTYQAMAQCLEAGGNADLALACYEIGLGGPRDARFGEAHRVFGLEYVRLLRRIDRGELACSVPDYAKARLESVGREADDGPCDFRVVLAWNTDGTDVDLHVVEPTGETCSYNHRETRTGGRITQDVTQGYGPEMYWVRKAVRGTYRIRVHYYASDRNRASARAKAYVTVYEKWGTPEERVTRKVVTLADGKEMHDIATVKIGK